MTDAPMPSPQSITTRPFWREPALIFAALSGLAFVVLGLRAMASP